jgi:hypothetical protein
MGTARRYCAMEYMILCPGLLLALLFPVGFALLVVLIVRSPQPGARSEEKEWEPPSSSENREGMIRSEVEMKGYQYNWEKKIHDKYE